MSFRHLGLISPELRQTLEEQQLVAQTKARIDWASKRTPFANLVNLIETRAKRAMDLGELNLLKYPFDPAINQMIMLMDIFVKITASIKNEMQDTFGVGALNLRGLEDHPEISSIKIYTTLLPMLGTRRNTPMVIIRYRNKAESDYFIAGGNFRDILRDECKNNILSTNDCEIYTTKRNATSIDEEEMQVRQMLQWGILSSITAWEDVPAMKLGPMSNEETLQPKFYYEQVLDPIVVDKFVKHAPTLINALAEDKTINILDVGAGKGRLAKKIIAEARRLNLNVHYYFLEPNKMQINQAKKDLADEMKAEGVEITYIYNELMGIKFKNNKKMHCIISAGGPLNREVATHEGAKTHIGHMYSMMAEQGILIAVGMTAFVVKSDHFKEKGFSMLSYTASLPEKVRKSKENLDKKMRKEGSTYEHVACYVCQKPVIAPPKEVVKTQDIYRHLRALLQNNETVNLPVSPPLRSPSPRQGSPLEEKEEKLDPIDERSKEILTSIDALGLTSPQASSQRGYFKTKSNVTPDRIDRVFYNQIDLTSLSEKEVRESFAGLVYHYKEGMWAISMERDFSACKGAQDLIDAAMNGVVFIFENHEKSQAFIKPQYIDWLCKHPDLPECKQESNIDFSTQNPLQAVLRKLENEKLYFEEVRQDVTAEHPGIARKFFKAIMAPEHLVGIVKSIYKDLTVIPIPVTAFDLEADPLEFLPHQVSAKGQKILGPDYVLGLHQFRKMFPNVKKLGIHLARMPLKQVWKRLRISDNNEQRLQTLIQVLKEYPKQVYLSQEAKNSYLVFYQASFSTQVKDLIKNPAKNSAAKIIGKAYRRHLNKEAVDYFKSRHKKMAIKKARMERFFKCGQFDRLALTSELAHGIKQETLAKVQEFKELGPVKFRAELKK